MTDTQPQHPNSAPLPPWHGLDPMEAYVRGVRDQMAVAETRRRVPMTPAARAAEHRRRAQEAGYAEATD